MDKSLHKKGRPDSSSLNINENHGIQERVISCGILIDIGRICGGDGKSA